MKYTLIAEDEYGGSKTTREFTEDFLPHVLTEIELFLKGAGFVFNGNLDFVDDFAETNMDFGLEQDFDECFTDEPESEMYDSKEVLSSKSPYYFDPERNK
jgi:hypothetical protein